MHITLIYLEVNMLQAMKYIKTGFLALCVFEKRESFQSNVCCCLLLPSSGVNSKPIFHIQGSSLSVNLLYF